MENVGVYLIVSAMPDQEMVWRLGTCRLGTCRLGTYRLGTCRLGICRWENRMDYYHFSMHVNHSPTFDLFSLSCLLPSSPTPPSPRPPHPPTPTHTHTQGHPMQLCGAADGWERCHPPHRLLQHGATHHWTGDSWERWREVGG